MSIYSIYLIDDNPDRHALLPRLRDSLIKLSGFGWKIGFEELKSDLWKNEAKIIEALNDPSGVILLDLDLRDPKLNLNIAEALDFIFKQDKEYAYFLDSPEFEEICNQGGGYTLASSRIFAAALVRNRHLLIVSQFGYSNDLEKKNRIAREAFPRFGNQSYEERRLTKMAAAIIDLVNISPYDKAAQVWQEWGASKRQLFFPIGPFHDLPAWLSPDPHMVNKRPFEERQVIAEAQKLLVECKCIDVDLDFGSAIKLLKGVAHDQSHLSVDCVKIFGFDSERSESSFEINKFSEPNSAYWLKCNSNAGQVALAISQLRSSNTNSPALKLHKKMILRPAVGQENSAIYELLYEARFEPMHEQLAEGIAIAEKAAADAVEILRLSPRYRMARDRREEPGQATEACYWLTQAAAARSSISVDRDDRTKLILRCEFNLVSG